MEPCIISIIISWVIFFIVLVITWIISHQRRKTERRTCPVIVTGDYIQFDRECIEKEHASAP